MDICAASLNWKKAMLAVVCCFVCSSALAHIKNEASQFPDIEYSEFRFDIVVLVGAGIIPETPVFEPDKLLSKRELATWAADLGGPGGETPDTDALASAALEQGLVDTLDGDATYADLNALFFQSQLSVDSPERTLTKGAAASFIATQLGTDAGLAMLAARGLGFGGTGEVSAVAEGASHTYVMTVNGTELPMSAHGRVANGPADLMQWQGRIVRRSFVRGQGDAAMWAYLEAEPIEELISDESMTTQTQEINAPPPIDRNLLYGLVVAVLLLGLALFFRRKRRG